MSMLRRRMMMAVKNPSNTLPDYSSYRGVYIEDMDGYLYTEAEWDGSKTPNGVAVLTDNCRYVIALQNASVDSKWSATEGLIGGVTTSDNEDDAAKDYNGKKNTESIVNELGVAVGYAAMYCDSFVFPNGNKGYLGAAGEWKAALDNHDAVVSAMSVCGGTALGNFYWSSTQANYQKAWEVFFKSKFISDGVKIYTSGVRAFTTLKSDDQQSGGGGNDFGIEFPLYIEADYCDSYIVGAFDCVSNSLGVTFYTNFLNFAIHTCKTHGELNDGVYYVELSPLDIHIFVDVNGKWSEIEYFSADKDFTYMECSHKLGGVYNNYVLLYSDSIDWGY